MLLTHADCAAECLRADAWSESTAVTNLAVAVETGRVAAAARGPDQLRRLNRFFRVPWSNLNSPANASLLIERKVSPRRYSLIASEVSHSAK